MFEDNIVSETNLCFHVFFNAEFELVSLAFCSGSQNADVGGIFVSLVFDECLLEFIVEFEVACRKDLEDRVPVIFEVQNIITGLVLDFDVCEALRCEQSLVLPISLEAFDEDPLSEP